MAGRPTIGSFDLFDSSEHRTRIAGQYPSNGLATCAPPKARRKTSSRSDALALLATREALAHADLVSVEDAGIFFGTSAGGMLEGEDFFERMRRGEWNESRRVLASQQNNCSADHLARTLGVGGPVEVISSACAASTMAIEAALQALRAGEVEVALAGGVDALCRMTYAGFNSLRAVDEEPSQPFREGRGGLSLGEGSGVLVLETLEHALARGAAPIAELSGAGSSCDAYHMTAPNPEGTGAAQAIRSALNNAGISSREIDFINLHGTGTEHNDAAEWQALRQVFGDRAGSIPATSTKGAIGHLLGGCGGLEAVVSVLCLDAGRVHATPGHGPIDPKMPLDLVLSEARVLERSNFALSTNLAFGGANAAIVIGRWQGE